MQHSVEVFFVDDHEALRDGQMDNNTQVHRVTLTADTDLEALLVAAQMVIARGKFVIGTDLVL